MKAGEKKYDDYIQQIKGSDYMPVAGRVLMFWDSVGAERRASILTEDCSGEKGIVKIRARATIRDAEGKVIADATGYASECVGDSLVNSTSALENAETSAVGRALGFLGIGLLPKGGIASADEMRRAVEQQETPRPAVSEPSRIAKAAQAAADAVDFPVCPECGKKTVEKTSRDDAKVYPGRRYYACKSCKDEKGFFVVATWEPVEVWRERLKVPPPTDVPY